MTISQLQTILPRAHGDAKQQKFTPGPYHACGSGPRMRSIKSAGGRTIAHVLFSEKRESECEATARLMAAAPDLLLQLRWLVSDCPCGKTSGSRERTDLCSLPDRCDKCVAALAAIAKVEGY